MKLSPLSIPYRVVERASSLLIIALFALGGGTQQFVSDPVIILIPVILGVLAIVTYEVAYYQRFEYELTPDTIDIHSGVFSQRTREIPYGRIQNVDITRNVLQRAMGIARVNLETAGGSETEGSIRFVTVSEASRIQSAIQQRKRGAEDDGGTPPIETELYAITPQELGLVGVLSFDPRIIGLLALVGTGSVPVISQYVSVPTALVLTISGLLVVGGLVVASWALGVLLAVVNYYGFRITKSEDELRYERGLLRRYNGSIPLSKVQTINIEDNPLKRAFDYATLTVETAGYAPGQGGERGSQAAVPIAKRDRVNALATEIESISTIGIEFDRPPKRVRYRYLIRYILVIGILTGIAFAITTLLGFPIPWYVVGGLVVFAPPAAHLKWKHRGYHVGLDHVLTRNGFWNRSVNIIPYYRIQTIIDSRSVFQRRWNIATLIIDTASTQSIFGGGAVIVDIDQETASEVRGRLNDRFNAALIDQRDQSRSSFQWVGNDVATG